MSFRIYDQAPQYLTESGRVLAGGSLTFCVNGGAPTLKDIWIDRAKTTLAANPMPLDAAGRTETDAWGDGSYTVICKNSLGVVQWTRDDVEASNGLPDPIGHTGEVLISDGTGYVFSELIEIPDPTGNDGEFLSTDGTDVFWVALPVSAGDKKQTVVAAATTNIDYSLGGIVELTQDTNITLLTFSNLPASGTPAVIIITRVKDNTATARTITWPTSILFPANADPTLTQTANGRDEIGLLTWDAGVKFNGKYVTNLS